MALRVAASRFATSIRPQAPVFARRTGAVRTMGSDPADLPTEGWEGAVRAKFPKDYQIVILILGSYAGLIGLNKLMGSSEEEAAPASSGGGGGGDSIPSFQDEKWDEWSKQGDNLARWEASLDKDD